MSGKSIYILHKNKMIKAIELINKKTIYSWFKGRDQETYRVRTFDYDRIDRFSELPALLPTF